MRRFLWCALLASAGAVAAPLGMDQFRAWDYNRDGFVDAAEAKSSVDLSGRFGEMDQDRDGRISTAEMEQWLAVPAPTREAWPPQPIRAQEQSRAIEEQRALREADRAQRILDDRANLSAYRIGPPASAVNAPGSLQRDRSQ